MKVNILDIKSDVNKDCMGSMGLGFNFGQGFWPFIIGKAKHLSVKIPDLQLAYVAAIHKQLGDEVVISEKPVRADKYYIHTSINGWMQEVAVAGSLDNVHFIGAVSSAMPDFFGKFGNVVIGELEKTYFKSINDYPFPAWELFNVESFKYFPSLRVRPVVPMLTSRGCKYKCHYCPYYSYYGERKERSISNVLSEMEYLKGLGVKGIVFRDPLFTSNLVKTFELMSKMRKFGFQFACETRFEDVTDELLFEMKLSGCRAIHFGIESANEEVCKDVGRVNISKGRMKSIVDLCQRLKIRTNCFFILGLPKDTKETIRETIDLAKWLNPNVAEFFVAQPYPGTRLAQRVVATDPIEKMDGYHLTYKHDNLSKEEVNDLMKRAYSKFYSRPKLWIKNLA